MGRRSLDTIIRAERIEVAMFIVYVVLFLVGFYLFGAAFNAEAWQGLIFTGGILSVSLAVAILFHTQRRT